MTTRRFHANLTSSAFPFLFSELSSTVVQATPYEQNRQVSGGFSGNDAEQSLGICQAYFMQNVLPISRGYASVAFVEALPEIVGVEDVIYHACIRGAGNESTWIASTTTTLYVWDTTTLAWLDETLPGTATRRPFVCQLKGRTFVIYTDLDTVYEYDFGTQTFAAVTLNGITVSDMLGFIAADAYLVAWDSNTIYWCSNTDPLEWDPVLDVTAGSTGVLGLRGEVTTAVPLGSGFVLYSAANAVAAAATANTLVPFQLSEIAGSAGIASELHVTRNTNRDAHLIWTAGGFQEVNLRKAEYVFPELSDAIIRGRVTLLSAGLPTLHTSGRLNVRLAYAGNRWLCITVERSTEEGSEASICHVYDTALARWGSLYAPHMHVVEYVTPVSEDRYTYGELDLAYATYGDLVGVPYSTFRTDRGTSAASHAKSIGFTRADGRIFTCALYTADGYTASEVGAEAATPSLWLGRFKMFRTQGAKLQNLRAIGTTAATSVLCHGHRQDGTIVSTKTDMAQSANQPGAYYGRVNADSFSIVLHGGFALTDLVIEATEAGMRNQRFA